MLCFVLYLFTDWEINLAQLPYYTFPVVMSRLLTVFSGRFISWAEL